MLPSSPYERDIQQAIEYSEQQEICTDEYKELVSPDGKIEYGATDGCQISFLEKRGWKEAHERIPEREIVKTCSEDECGWVSTNCCPESAGANWECINEEESVIECPGDPVCPQVIVPKPETDCSCVEGVCQEL